MGLPAKQKTYEYDLNNNIVGDATQPNGAQDGTLDRINLLLALVLSMTNGGTWTVPWTVQGTSDASTSGFPGPGWASASDIQWTDGTTSTPPINAHSWIVLYHPTLDIHLLIECVSQFNTDGNGLICYISRNGFGVANGGTDGSITSRPTATDEQNIRNGFNNQDGCWSGNATADPRQWKWNIVASNDGEVWNMFWFFNGEVIGFWRFEVPDNPPANWSGPVIARMHGFNSDGASFGAFSPHGSIGFDPVRRPDGSQFRVDVYGFSWGWSDATNFRQASGRINVINPVSGNPMMFPLWYYTNAGGMRGRLGKPYDLYIRQTVVGGSTGDTYPAAQPDWIVLAGLDHAPIIPWDGVTIPLTS
jgi:hypothetical protein